MQADNPFDRKLELNRHLPEGVREALINVNDTLEYAWLSAQTVFEEKATPEHAIAIGQMMLAERERVLDRLDRAARDGTE